MKQVLYFYRQLYSFVGKKLYFNLLGMVFISLLDGVGLLLLLPLVTYSGIVNVNEQTMPLEMLFQGLNQVPKEQRLILILGLFVLINVILNIIQRYVTVKNVKIQHGFAKHLRLEIYRDLLLANWDFYIKRRKTDIINTITSELARVSAGTNIFLQFITSIIFTFIQIGIAFFLAPKITAFVLISGLFLAIFSRGFIKRSSALGNKTSENGKNFLAGITDNFNGMKEIKSNNLEKSRMDWFHSITQKMYVEQMEYIQLKTTSQFYYKISSVGLIALFIFFSVNLFQAQAAQLMLILVIFSRLWPRVTGIQSSLEQIATIVPALKAVIKLSSESRNAKEFKGLDERHKQRLEIHRGILCKNVYFRYIQGDNKYSLKNINISFPANQMTAIVGPSGAGKSTLVDLVMGLNQPEKGEILIDGVKLTQQNLLGLRQSVSYVPQDPFLFNTTIRENLLLTRASATEQELWEALEFASADFVKQLPNGLDTLIGDRGIRLSGGERQRVVLARAILRNPEILVLDEATSALDTENERKIQESLERLKGKMMIIVIAHRLSTIQNADQVIVLDQGQIIQSGKFNQLAKDRRGLFSHLLGKQLEATL
ncbi:ABC transporter ATP-binding protein [Robertmurraya sp. P23]|uniref:ABC transporter ATP-binding protein n=1 Tax=Robertmurraya sp. P23 TaxID=3436931 RepID=UPI003D96A095